MNDNLFKKGIILLVAIAIFLLTGILSSWFLGIDIKSIKLWVGAFIPAVLIFSFYITPLFYGRVITIAISPLLITAYFVFILNWSFNQGLIGGLVMMMFMFSVYFALM